jgi:hypothetical protein
MIVEDVGRVLEFLQRLSPAAIDACFMNGLPFQLTLQ